MVSTCTALGYCGGARSKLEPLQLLMHTAHSTLSRAFISHSNCCSHVVIASKRIHDLDLYTSSYVSRQPSRGMVRCMGSVTPKSRCCLSFLVMMEHMQSNFNVHVYSWVIFIPIKRCNKGYIAVHQIHQNIL